MILKPILFASVGLIGFISLPISLAIYARSQHDEAAYWHNSFERELVESHKDDMVLKFGLTYEDRKMVVESLRRHGRTFQAGWIETENDGELDEWEGK